MTKFTLVLSLFIAQIHCSAGRLSAAPKLSPPVLPGLLRPQASESRQLLDITGIWEFKPESYSGQGVQEQWYSKPLRTTGNTQPMPVPSSYNDITTTASLRDYVGTVWYDTQVFIPKAWSTERVNLYFGSVHYYADVWVNGVHVVAHEGGHLPFEATVSSLLVAGNSNRITVACNNTLTTNTLPPGSLSVNTVGRTIQNLQMDFFNYAGIHREVWIYTTDANTHVDDVTCTSNINGDNAVINVAVAASGTSQLELQLQDADGNTVTTNSTTNIVNGMATLTLTVSNPNLWWPWTMSSQPGYLYTLTVQASGASASDTYRLSYGIRTIAVSGTQLLLNGKPLYLTGFGGHHEDADVRGKALDLPMIVRDFNMMKWLGANSFRTSHYPYSDVIMDMADRLGFMVIDESPAVGVQCQNQVNATLVHHLVVEAELIRRDKNRPSPIIWSVANEPTSTCSNSASYFGTVLDAVRSLDKTRPVTFVTMEDYYNDVVVPMVDIIMINRYYGWYIQTGELDTIQHDLMQDINNWHQKYPTKPIMETEYGADTVAGLHDVNDFIFTEDFQTAFVDNYFFVFDALRNQSNPFWVGEHAWCFSDFMTGQSDTRVVGNRKGVLTRTRQPKAAAYAYRSRYHNIAAASGQCPLDLATLNELGCSL